MPCILHVVRTRTANPDSGNGSSPNLEEEWHINEERQKPANIPVRCSTLWMLCSHVYVYLKQLFQRIKAR
ncbi:hypothetical protein HMPREF0083_01557 [Aneurinibacillus aneurinilyticus ATCC 12856]|uniref:Uncharacterized protein n=1 Tax=Aneurinibacillus aneurinilyticus ATCC 12856 TaxID=649747 RepID=U1YHU6_ANEAE|nr:hypothetical protein HMPREF0083_01557 [Aneurinibacillus aneurinilyticus ATCC 12856]